MQVASYKYSGANIDCELNWHSRVSSLCVRIRQLLHLRRLRLFGVSSSIMLTFYKATIESILRYGIIVWVGNLTVNIWTQVNNLMRVAGKIMRIETLSSLQDIFELCKILSDSSHVLFLEYELMNSGIRYRVPLCNYKHSFVPFSIKLINEQLGYNG